MPEICRFYGIVIQMYFNDHAPAHFHARYGSDRAVVCINPPVVLQGHAQLEMLPSPDEVSTIVSQLGIDNLREFAASIMNAAVDSAHKGHVDLDTVRFLNGWFASMEETVAAGDRLEEILSRRRKRREPANR